MCKSKFLTKLGDHVDPKSPRAAPAFTQKSLMALRESQSGFACHESLSITFIESRPPSFVVCLHREGGASESKVSFGKDSAGVVRSCEAQRVLDEMGNPMMYTFE